MIQKKKNLEYGLHELCKRFTDEEAGAAANGRVIARVFTTWDAFEGVVWRDTV